jgi:hypothetical protein
MYKGDFLIWAELGAEGVPDAWQIRQYIQPISAHQIKAHYTTSM